MSCIELYKCILDKVLGGRNAVCHARTDAAGLCQSKQRTLTPVQAQVACQALSQWCVQGWVLGAHTWILRP
jgi:hypothetical protein